jgi:hypothetical protein
VINFDNDRRRRPTRARALLGEEDWIRGRAPGHATGRRGLEPLVLGLLLVEAGPRVPVAVVLHEADRIVADAGLGAADDDEQLGGLAAAVVVEPAADVVAADGLRALVREAAVQLLANGDDRPVAAAPGRGGGVLARREQRVDLLLDAVRGRADAGIQGLLVRLFAEERLLGGAGMLDLVFIVDGDQLGLRVLRRPRLDLAATPAAAQPPWNAAEGDAGGDVAADGLTINDPCLVHGLLRACVLCDAAGQGVSAQLRMSASGAEITCKLSRGRGPRPPRYEDTELPESSESLNASSW